MAHHLSIERFEIILSLNHPAKIFPARPGDLGVFRVKSFIADDHRRRRVSPNGFLLPRRSLDLQFFCKSAQPLVS